MKHSAKGTFRRETTLRKVPHSATGAYDVTISSQTHYKKFSLPKTGKKSINNCNCYTCKDSEFTYGNSSVLIEDSDPKILTLFCGRDLTK